MLKLNPKPTFDADVTVTVPGQEDPGVIRLTFKYMSKAAWLEFLELNQDSPDADVIAGLVVGWKGMDVDYSPENMGIFLNNYPAAAGEIIRAYVGLVLESRIKN